MLNWRFPSDSVKPVLVMLKKPVVWTWVFVSVLGRGGGRTAWRGCSASFRLPPGSLKVEMWITDYPPMANRLLIWQVAAIEEVTLAQEIAEGIMN